MFISQPVNNQLSFRQNTLLLLLSFLPFRLKSKIAHIEGIYYVFNRTTRILCSDILSIKDNIYHFHRQNLIKCIEYCSKVDVIHLHSEDVNYIRIVYKLYNEFNIPFVITMHSGNFNLNKYDSQDIKTFHLASKVVTVSSSNARKLHTNLNIEIQIIHNLVDNDIFYLKSSHEKPTKKFTFIMLASTLAPTKGTLTLLNAIALTKDLDYSIIIGGSTTYQKELIEISKKMGIYDKIIWKKGMQKTEMAKLLNSSHCFILPSQAETFGVVLIEALATGLPVISTKCGGPEDIVTENNGILINVDDDIQLSKSMRFMIDNASRIYNANEIVKETLNKFHPEIICRKYHTLYNEVMIKSECMMNRKKNNEA